MTTITTAHRPTVGDDRHCASAPDDEAAMCLEGAPAATFERRGPLFAPPVTPKLIDERQARCARELEKIRDDNEALIRAYGKRYERYLDRFAQAVERAPTAERAAALGDPVRYDAGLSSLPQSQRAYYDALISQPHLETAVVVKDAQRRALAKIKP